LVDVGGGTNVIVHDASAPLPWSVSVGHHVDHRMIEDWCCDNLGPRVRPQRGFIWRPDDARAWHLGDRPTRWLFREEDHAVWFAMVWA
jgi:hypothetical protein